MELFVLGVVVGGVAGSRGRDLVKGAVKGGLALSDAAKSLKERAGDVVKPQPALKAETPGGEK